MRILLNEQPVTFEGYNLFFYATRYADNSLAIICEDEQCTPYATISINLSGYGITLNDTMIVLNHGLSTDLTNLVLDMFSKQSDRIEYGFAKSFLIHIKDEYIEKIKRGEENEI